VTVRRMTAARPLSVQSLSQKIQALCGRELVALGDQRKPTLTCCITSARASSEFLFYAFDVLLQRAPEVTKHFPVRRCAGIDSPTQQASFQLSEKSTTRTRGTP
jgi:hypothetical protein